MDLKRKRELMGVLGGHYLVLLSVLFQLMDWKGMLPRKIMSLVRYKLRGKMCSLNIGENHVRQPRNLLLMASLRRVILRCRDRNMMGHSSFKDERMWILLRVGVIRFLHWMWKENYSVYISSVKPLLWAWKMKNGDKELLQ